MTISSYINLLSLFLMVPLLFLPNQPFNVHLPFPNRSPVVNLHPLPLTHEDTSSANFIPSTSSPIRFPSHVWGAVGYLKKYYYNSFTTHSTSDSNSSTSPTHPSALLGSQYDFHSFISYHNLSLNHKSFVLAIIANIEPEFYHQAI